MKCSCGVMRTRGECGLVGVVLFSVFVSNRKYIPGALGLEQELYQECHVFLFVREKEGTKQRGVSISFSREGRNYRTYVRNVRT